MKKVNIFFRNYRKGPIPLPVHSNGSHLSEITSIPLSSLQKGQESELVMTNGLEQKKRVRKSSRNKKKTQSHLWCRISVKLSEWAWTSITTGLSPTSCRPISEIFWYSRIKEYRENNENDYIVSREKICHCNKDITKICSFTKSKNIWYSVYRGKCSKKFSTLRNVRKLVAFDT